MNAIAGMVDGGACALATEKISCGLGRVSRVGSLLRGRKISSD